MKPIIHFLLLALALVTALAGAQTNTPSEQFQSAVAAFQQSATEDNARKLAELLKQLDPPPAIPDDAKLHALKGAAFVKQTKSETDPAAFAALFAKAAAEYQAASAAAPWVGDYYFNRASCEKSAGQFAAATAALKLDLIFARTEQDRDANLALRADIETTQEIAATRKQAAEKAKSELAAKEAAAAAAKQQAAAAAEERKKNSIEGYWFWTGNSYFEASTSPNIQIERVGQTLVVKPVFQFSGVTITETQITEKSLRITYMPAGTINCHMLLIYELNDGDLVGTTTNLEMREKGSKNAMTANRYIRKPWPAN